MSLTAERLQSEQLFHDRQAVQRAVSFQRGEADLRFADAAYLDHESWIRPAWATLGELSGKRVLDYGCGHGMAAVVMARAGATVHACDLSPQYVAEAQQRAIANRVCVDAVVANGEALPYPDESFDAIWGCAILHHLDLARAAAELNRVLVPGGVAVFCEPWGGNPLLSFARRRLPYPGKHRTADEQPLTRSDLRVLRNEFPQLRTQGFQFLEMLNRVTRCRWPIVGRIDRSVLHLCPPLENWCRYLVITLTKD